MVDMGRTRDDDMEAFRRLRDPSAAPFGPVAPEEHVEEYLETEPAMFDKVARLRHVPNKLTTYLVEKSGLKMEDMQEVLTITGEYQDIVIRLMLVGNGHRRSTSVNRKMQPQRRQQLNH